MKQINVMCKPSGVAIVTTSDVHIDNESNASKIVIDFTLCLDYLGENKWVDLVMGDGTSLRYDLGTEDIVTKELEYQNTIAGEMVITPFIYNGLVIKIKFKPNRSILIYKVIEAGNGETLQRDDYVFEMKENVDSCVTFKNQFEFLTTTEFELIERESGKIYGVYSELTGEITWYFSDVGV
jgi:hypothetical protein